MAAPPCPTDRRVTGEGGGTILEFALLVPFLAMMVFGVVDLGRVWQLKNRVTSAAREGAAVAQFTPGFVSAGCNGTNNITDRVKAEDSRLANASGLTITVKDLTTGQTLTGCQTGTVSSGDQIAVTVKAPFVVLTPFVSVATGQVIQVSGYAQVVVQG